MGRWLDALKNSNQPDGELTKLTKAPANFQDSPNNELTKPTKAPSVSFVSGQHKESENYQPAPEDRCWDVPGGVSPAPRNVFDPANRLPYGVIFATECHEHPQCFIAYRVGTKAPVGHGAMQCDAVLNLADLEAIQNKTPDYPFPPT